MHKLIARTFLFLFLTACAFCTSASEREVVAKIYGQAIYRDQLQDNGRNLESLLTVPLFEHFSAENNIRATESEIDEFIAATAGISPPATFAEQRAAMHDMAKNFVLGWKVNKALYKKYGGDVIFQQANPLEPVGAERRFLEEQEKSGAFQILDAKERAKFFEYYVRPQHFVIPPSKVNYDLPWWRGVKSRQ
ncbi:MAG: hypothetical protein JWQ61_3426 [Collimonas fungivorans]|uniref:hypothetical protein n=1 Tax=Collimonas fungivorans TaxID=158899 RepID=UPI0026F01CBC|nr:hypothetical protein [Collimonas fungivorans]MDB5768612.1 hypothetical protein [Collimonas fungivorans]